MSSDLPPDDAEPFEPPGPLALPDDPEVPEADALDQARAVEPVPGTFPTERAIEVPEADAIDQATEVVLDDDEE
jgi:hypothetical protein